MSDETPGERRVDLGKAGAEKADPPPTPTARPRPTTPGAAASRRARQLGGPRRPSPHPRPEADAAPEAAATTATASTTASTSTTAPSSSTKRTPSTRPASRSGVGARRPRPTAGTADDTTTATTAADNAAAESDAADSETTGTPARPRRRVLAGAGVLLAVALLAVGAVFLVLTLRAKPQISASETERALAAAKSDVALVTTYGYQTVDADAAKAAAVLTGEFRSQYLDSIQTVVKPQLPTTQTVTTGQVDTAGLVSADAKGRQVVVLVYGQQSVTNKAQTTPRIDAFQIRVTMQQVKGTWLVSQLEQLGNNA